MIGLSPSPRWACPTITTTWPYSHRAPSARNRRFYSRSVTLSRAMTPSPAIIAATIEAIE